MVSARRIPRSGPVADEKGLTNHGITIALAGGALLGPFRATWSTEILSDVRELAKDYDAFLQWSEQTRFRYHLHDSNTHVSSPTSPTHSSSTSSRSRRSTTASSCTNLARLTVPIVPQTIDTVLLVPARLLNSAPAIYRRASKPDTSFVLNMDCSPC